jgi:hypothetical protein
MMIAFIHFIHLFICLCVSLISLSILLGCGNSPLRKQPFPTMTPHSGSGIISLVGKQQGKDRNKYKTLSFSYFSLLHVVSLCVPILHVHPVRLNYQEKISKMSNVLKYD